MQSTVQNWLVKYLKSGKSPHFATYEEAHEKLSDSHGPHSHCWRYRCKCGRETTCRCRAPKILVHVDSCPVCRKDLGMWNNKKGTPQHSSWFSKFCQKRPIANDGNVTIFPHKVNGSLSAKVSGLSPKDKALLAFHLLKDNFDVSKSEEGDIEVILPSPAEGLRLVS